MNIDRVDLLTISFGSLGFFLGSIVGFALQSDHVVLFQAVGVVTGVSFAIGAVRSGKGNRSDS